MDSILTGLELGVAYSLPVILFGVLYRAARWLDLSLDAQIAAAGVTFVLILSSTGSFWLATLAGLAASCTVCVCLFGVVELGKVPVEIASMLLAFIVFKALELRVGESITIPRTSSRMHVYLRSYLGDWTDLALSILLVIAFVGLLEGFLRSHLGLMYRALGDNPGLQVRMPRPTVRGLVSLLAGVLVGIAGIYQADRAGGVFSGFHLNRVLDGFICAELAAALQRRARHWADAPRTVGRRFLVMLAETPLTIQLLATSVFLGTLSYVLVRYLHPAVPALIEAAVVLLMLTRFAIWKKRTGTVSETEGLGFHHLTKTYRSGSNKIPVLVDVNVQGLPSEGLVVLVGDTGSGKSTLLRVAAGLLQPDRGEVTFNGETAARHCRFLSQDPLGSIAPSLTVRENLGLAVARVGKAKLSGYLSTAEATRILSQVSHADALIKGLDRPAFAFSGGQIQLLAVTCALADTSTKILLADEPTKMLDQSHRRLVQDQLLDLAKSRLVVISSHEPRLDLVPDESHLWLRGGRLHRGIPVQQTARA